MCGSARLHGACRVICQVKVRKSVHVYVCLCVFVLVHTPVCVCWVMSHVTCKTIVLNGFGINIFY